MSEPLGCLCIVLHGHLPYVLHHGSYPHGEAWLYEAAAETYLPLLDMIGEVALHKAHGLKFPLARIRDVELGDDEHEITFTLGGTSLLIVVNVTMDTVSQVQSHLIAHQYGDLIKKAKLKGAKRR